MPGNPWIVTLRGFTLLELLVVLTIAGLLLTVVPPMVSAVLPGTEMRTASRELTLALRHARLDAVSNGTTVEVMFADNPARYAVGDKPFRLLPEDTELRIGYLASSSSNSASYRELADHPYRLRFSPDGSSSGATLLLTRDGSHHAVSVGWLMGRVTVSTEAGHDF